MTRDRPALAAFVFALVAGVLFPGCGSDASSAGAPSTSETTSSAPEAEVDGLLTLLDDVAPEVAAAGAGTTTTTATLPPGSEGYPHSAAALAALGDDARLDDLALDCYQADLTACDDLFVAGPAGSLYEVYGATCGARIDQPTNRLCVDVLLPAGDEPTGLGDDAFANALAEQCYAGDLLDCDLLYASADRGSQYEAYGATCGRRLDTEDDCTAAVR